MVTKAGEQDTFEEQQYSRHEDSARKKTVTQMTPKFNINNSKLSGIDKERNSEMESKRSQENKSEVAN